MSVTVEQLEEMMTFKEGESLEFKEAKNNFHFETLVKYCVALANEEGGDVELKFDGAICNVGTTRAALWYPGSKTDTIASAKKFNHDNNAI